MTTPSPDTALREQIVQICEGVIADAMNAEWADAVNAGTDRILAILTPAPSPVTEAWRPTPKDATIGMVHAAIRIARRLERQDDYANIWSAMWDAAPSPPRDWSAEEACLACNEGDDDGR